MNAAFYSTSPSRAPPRPSPGFRSLSGISGKSFALGRTTSTPDAELDEYPFPVAGSLGRSTKRARLDRPLPDFAPVALQDDETALDDDSGDEQEIEGDPTLTPLDISLEKIGMGVYQYRLLFLCGAGFCADNMWLNAIAVILPRVQQHFDITDRWIGVLSASIFAGMMIGAAGWGSYSDAKGRTPAFNLTLLLTAIFGLFSAFAPTFFWLCAGLFGLGLGVGGSMPTDGTLFLENIPKTHHYLLTGLSVFFSFGAVITSILGLIIIPRYSCPEAPLEGVVCDVERDNLGWRYMLGFLGVVSIAMFIARIVFFRLEESAKFLANAGDHAGALVALQRISKINGDSESEWSLEDVIDRLPTKELEGEGISGKYDAMGESEESYEERSNASPVAEEPPIGPLYQYGVSSSNLSVEERKRGEKLVMGSSWVGQIPMKLWDSMGDFPERIDRLFEPEWALTTKLVWVIWFAASAGYTIFNVFLPKWLETKVGNVPGGGGRQASLEDYVLYTVSGIPGSILGAYLIETSWGRKGTMAISTIATFFGILVFVTVHSQLGVVVSSMGVSLAVTTMYAVIYGYTPEVFEPRVRGTACGIASALSRFAGIIAPIVTGLLLSIDVSLPLYLSAAFFVITAGCMIALPIETRSNGRVFAAAH